MREIIEELIQAISNAQFDTEYKADPEERAYQATGNREVWFEEVMGNTDALEASLKSDVQEKYGILTAYVSDMKKEDADETVAKAILSLLPFAKGEASAEDVANGKAYHPSAVEECFERIRGFTMTYADVNPMEYVKNVAETTDELQKLRMALSGVEVPEGGSVSEEDIRKAWDEKEAVWEKIVSAVVEKADKGLESAPDDIKGKIANLGRDDTPFVYARNDDGSIKVNDAGEKVVEVKNDLHLTDNGQIADRYGISPEGRIVEKSSVDVKIDDKRLDGLKEYCYALNQIGKEIAGDKYEWINDSDIIRIEDAVRSYKFADENETDRGNTNETFSDSLEKYAKAVCLVYGVKFDHYDDEKLKNIASGIEGLNVKDFENGRTDNEQASNEQSKNAGGQTGKQKIQEPRAEGTQHGRSILWDANTPDEKLNKLIETRNGYINSNPISPTYRKSPAYTATEMACVLRAFRNNIKINGKVPTGIDCIIAINSFTQTNLIEFAILSIVGAVIDVIADRESDTVDKDSKTTDVATDGGSGRKDSDSSDGEKTEKGPKDSTDRGSADKTEAGKKDRPDNARANKDAINKEKDIQTRQSAVDSLGKAIGQVGEYIQKNVKDGGKVDVDGKTYGKLMRSVGDAVKIFGTKATGQIIRSLYNDKIQNEDKLNVRYNDGTLDRDSTISLKAKVGEYLERKLSNCTVRDGDNKTKVKLDVDDISNTNKFSEEDIEKWIKDGIEPGKTDNENKDGADNRKKEGDPTESGKKDGTDNSKKEGDPTESGKKDGTDNSKKEDDPAETGQEDSTDKSEEDGDKPEAEQADNTNQSKEDGDKPETEQADSADQSEEDGDKPEAEQADSADQREEDGDKPEAEQEGGADQSEEDGDKPETEQEGGADQSEEDGDKPEDEQKDSADQSEEDGDKPEDEQKGSADQSEEDGDKPEDEQKDSADQSEEDGDKPETEQADNTDQSEEDGDKPETAQADSADQGEDDGDKPEDEQEDSADQSEDDGDKPEDEQEDSADQDEENGDKAVTDQEDGADQSEKEYDKPETGQEYGIDQNEENGDRAVNEPDQTSEEEKKKDPSATDDGLEGALADENQPQVTRGQNEADSENAQETIDTQEPDLNSNQEVTMETPDPVTSETDVNEANPENAQETIETDHPEAVPSEVDLDDTKKEDTEPKPENPETDGQVPEQTHESETPDPDGESRFDQPEAEGEQVSADGQAENVSQAEQNFSEAVDAVLDPYVGCDDMMAYGPEGLTVADAIENGELTPEMAAGVIAEKIDQDAENIGSDSTLQETWADAIGTLEDAFQDTGVFGFSELVSDIVQDMSTEAVDAFDGISNHLAEPDYDIDAYTPDLFEESMDIFETSEMVLEEVEPYIAEGIEAIVSDMDKGLDTGMENAGMENAGMDPFENTGSEPNFEATDSNQHMPDLTSEPASVMDHSQPNFNDMDMPAEDPNASIVDTPMNDTQTAQDPFESGTTPTTIQDGSWYDSVDEGGED